MFPIPAKTGRWRFISNVDQYAIGRTERCADAVVATDCYVALNRSDTAAIPHEQFITLRDELTERGCLVGTYISGLARLKTGDAPDTSPVRRLPFNRVPNCKTRRPLMADREIIDLRDPITQQQFGEKLVTEAKRRSSPLIFFDNIAHHMSDGYAPPWTTTARWLAAVRRQLNRLGIRLVANVACVPSELSTADADLLVSACDGVMFEQPYLLHVNPQSNVRGNLEREQRTMHTYRHLLDAGLAVFLMPHLMHAEWSDRAHEASMVATLAAMCYEPGDLLYIGWPWTSEESQWWFNLPSMTPIGWAENDNGIWKRTFALGDTDAQITLNGAQNQYDGAAVVNDLVSA